MANNPYVNKVVYGSSTLIDISDTTATASDVASGKYFYTAAGQKVQGTASSGSVVISDTTDSHGGTIKTITTGQAVNLQTKTITPTGSQQTITPDTGYNGFSEVIVEAVSGGYITQDANGHIILPPDGDVPRLITKSITQNGTYAASSDNATGFSSVSVNVQSSGNIDLGSTTQSTNGVSTLTFDNIYGEPQAFSLLHGSNLSFTYDGNNYIIAILYDGFSKIGAVLDILRGRISYVPPADANSGYSFVYGGNNNTLTITTNNYSGTGLFPSGDWYLMYTY